MVVPAPMVKVPVPTEEAFVVPDDPLLMSSVPDSSSVPPAYVFAPGTEDFPPGVLPRLEFCRIDERPFDVLGERFTPIPLLHGRFNVFGFRIGNVAYCTDVSSIPDRSWPLLEGLDVFVIDALRPGKPHPTHFCLEQAVEAIQRVKPRQAYFTHICHDLGHEEANAKLPAGVALAYDGLKLEVAI